MIKRFYNRFKKALELMNYAANVVMESIPDIWFAYG